MNIQTPEGLNRRRQLEASAWYLKDEYPFPSHFHETPAGNLHYIDEGAGHRRLVLVHGTPGWSFEFRRLIASFAERGYRVIAPDHIGFGLSDRPARWTYRPEDHAANLTSLLLKLDREAPPGSSLPEWHFVLHDFGGMIGLRTMHALTAEHPGRVRSVSVLNSWCRPFLEIDPGFAKQLPIVRSAFMRWLYRYMNFSARVMVKSAWGRGGLSRRMHRHFLALHRNAQDRLGTLGFLKATYDDEDIDFLKRTSTAAATSLKNVPMQLIWGAADGFVGPVHAQAWEDFFTVAMRTDLSNVGHFPHEEAPEDVKRLLVEFLEQHDAAATHG